MKLEQNILSSAKESFDLFVAFSASDDDLEHHSALSYYRDLCALADLVRFEDNGMSENTQKTLIDYYEKATPIFVNMKRPSASE